VSPSSLFQELQTLQLVRATFESIRQLVDAIHMDIVTMKGNCDQLTEVNKRWDAVINVPNEESTSEQPVKKPTLARR
ncbi:hypothetical protein BDZ91DRAFT_655183, partial [Kalaharituber pfeilii]